MADSLLVPTATRPLGAVVTVPGSKSIANRALICAALADGTTTLRGVPDGDDTVAMVGALRALGFLVNADRAAGEVRIEGGAGAVEPGPDTTLHAALAGTTSRFITALAALSPVTVTIDGDPPLRRRPMGPLHDALVQLGAVVDATAGDGALPVRVRGPLRPAGAVSLGGDVSSQFLSALMMIGPFLDGGLRIELTSPLVSVPYVRLTADVMAEFGLTGITIDDDAVVVPAGRYRGIDLSIEPDASTASYPLAMAAVAGGKVTIRGLRADSAQGDVAFADLLVRMGCRRAAGPDLGVERDRQDPLVGVDVDMADISDLVPTLAAVAVTAATPTHITGVGFIRKKESDRLGDLAQELAQLGASVTVDDDGLTIQPAALHGATLDPHHDHRLAMAFAVLGTAVPGVRVLDPDVVTKSWPGFWEARRRLVRPTDAQRRPVVVAFDVDGTLTSSDCVVPFLRLVGGSTSLVAGVARRGLRTLSAIGRGDRDDLKAVSAEAVFAGRSAAQVEGLGRSFASSFVAPRLREDTLARLRWHHRRGDYVVLVSASFGAYLRPLAERLGADGPPITVLATELVVAEGRCTGQLIDGNCRGPEKRRRLHAWLTDAHGGRTGVELWAYGDSAGDRELLADADHAVWAGDRIPAVPG